MDTEKFINQIRKCVIDENLEIYKELFNNMSISEITDEYWKEALPFYQELNSSQREILHKIIRQIMVDTIAQILRVIDLSELESYEDKNLELRCGGEVISGYLEDIFLSQEEECS